MPESLTERIVHLEAEVADLKGNLIGIVNGAVRAETFELLNSDGVPIAELTTTEDDEPAFILYDKKGQARFVMRLGDGKPQLSLLDQDGDTRLALGADMEGNLGLLMIGQYRRNRVVLGFGGKGEPYLHIAGTDGAVDLDTSLPPGWLGLSLVDESQKNRLAVALDPSQQNGNPFIVLTNHRGEQRWWRGN